MSAFPLHRTEIYPTREAWLAARAGSTAGPRIGASEVASILGVAGAFKSAWDIWAEKTGALPAVAPTAAEARVLSRGQRWERMVLAEYGETSGLDVMEPGEALGQPGALVMVRHAAEEWATCSPDAVVLDPRYGQGYGEAKTDIAGEWAREDVTLERADAYREDIAPPAKIAQCYWQIEVSGVPFVDLVCLLPRYEVRVVRVMADPGYQREILDIVGEWRERHVIRGEAPPVDGSEACGRYLARRYPGRGKDTRAATPEEAAILRELADTKALRKELEEREDVLANQLHAALGDTYGVTLDSGAKGLLIPMRGRLTAKLADIEAKHPEIFARLVADGLVTRGADYRQLRLYGF